MTSAQLAGWIAVIGLYASIGAYMNEYSTLGYYDAIDSHTGQAVRIMALKLTGPGADGYGRYLIAKAVFQDDHPVLYEKPIEVNADSVDNFGQVRKWLKEQKQEYPDMKKPPTKNNFLINHFIGIIERDNG